MLLAEAAAPSWQSTVAVCALLGSALGIGFTGLTAYYMKRQTDIMATTAAKPTQTEITNQPLPVEIVEALHDRFASKASFDAHVQENKKDMERISRERGEDLRASAGSRKTMYDKQDDLRKELSARIEAVNRDLTSKIENIPDKVISTLRNAGAIGGKQ